MSRAVTLVALAAVCVAVGLAWPGAARRQRIMRADAASGPTVSPPTAADLRSVAARYPVFRRAARTTDALPAGSAYAAGVARRIGAGSGPVHVWAVSVAGEVCVTDVAVSGPARGGTDGSASCVPLTGPDDLVAGVTTYPPGPAEVIDGLAPDGVSRVTIVYGDGTRTAVPVVDGGFADVRADVRPVSGFSWSADGVTHTEGGA